MVDAPAAASPDPATRMRGRMLVLIAAVMWSTSGLFAQAPLFDAWPRADAGGWPQRGILLAFWRALFASVVLLAFVRRPRWTWKLVPMTLIFVTMNVTFMAALTTTTAANAIWLQHTAPVWVFLASVFFLRDPVRRADWLLLVFAAAGVATILWFEARGENPAGVAWGLAGGLTYAGVVISLRWLRAEDAAWLVALNHLVTAVCLAPYAVTVGPQPDGLQLVVLAAFGMLQMGLPYLLFARGLRTLSGHEASGIVLLEPVLVPLWVLLAWGNAPAWWTIVGAAFILMGLVARYLLSPRTKQTS